MDAEVVLSLRVAAEPESIRDVRRAVAELLETYEVGRGTVDAARLAVSEACSNAVRHAYPTSHDGTIDVEAGIEGQTVTVVVRDHGQGLKLPTANPGAGLGLSLIRTLASRAEISSVPDNGTEVTMEFVDR